MLCMMFAALELLFARRARRVRETLCNASDINQGIKINDFVPPAVRTQSVSTGMLFKGKSFQGQSTSVTRFSHAISAVWQQQSGETRSQCYPGVAEFRLLTRQRATPLRRQMVMEIYLSRLWIRRVIPRGYNFKSGRKSEGHERCERKFEKMRMKIPQLV